ncbi:translation elongation factor Ts (EF-Ts) [Thermodesulforhabdus norvegica]|uniref:Elongation factor Ts n=2 Tax=Thermodesulforhabdus norvegica TaxID=39841 RepID=A0A1I4QN76_9BACT|nr:translation elongation factor Ts [Thermodesulforhabdus norvegica]SFM41160.1 translation elongation factor Ts (EF-Ts) [Thermodesulforhabdus norvegica]
MAVSMEMIKELRAKTNAGMMDCKRALEATNGDMEKAIDYLRQKGLATAMKRAGKEAKEGLVQAYVHGGGRIGVLVEINCETDFAARSDAFQEFAKNIAMQIAATNPLGVEKEDIPQEIVERERAIYEAQARETGKPENVIQKIVEGKMRKFFEEAALMEQPFIRDPDKTIRDYLNELVAQIGEKVVIRRFTRYQLGEE